MKQRAIDALPPWFASSPLNTSKSVFVAMDTDSMHDKDFYIFLHFHRSYIAHLYRVTVLYKHSSKNTFSDNSSNTRFTIILSKTRAHAHRHSNLHTWLIYTRFRSTANSWLSLSLFHNCDPISVDLLLGAWSIYYHLCKDLLFPVPCLTTLPLPKDAGDIAFNLD